MILSSGLTLTPSAQAITFTKLVDSTDQVPGEKAGTTFTNLNNYGPPVLSGNTALFASDTALWSIDINTGLPSLVKLVGTDTPIPQGIGNFAYIAKKQLKISDGKVFFGATGGNGEQRNQTGIYSMPVTGGTIATVINQSTQKPGARLGDFLGNNFLGSTFYVSDFLGSNVGFEFDFSVSLNQMMLTQTFIDNHYDEDSTYAISVNNGILLSRLRCELSTFDLYNPIRTPDISNGFVAFKHTFESNPLDNSRAFDNAIVVASFDQMKNYNSPCSKPSGSITIASGNDVVPSTEAGPRTFDSSYSLQKIQIDESTVVFDGAAKPISLLGIDNSDHDLIGLYSSSVNQDRKIRKLVDTNTPVPGGTGNFDKKNTFSNYSLNGNKVVFVGQDKQSKEGLYLNSTEGDALTKIIAAGDSLGDGRIISTLGFPGSSTISKPSLSGNHLVFRVYLEATRTDETAIYVATLSPDLTPNTDPKTCLMNWAEATYPALFSPAASTQTLAPYTYRYYKNPNAYLGISSADNHVYYLGADGVLKDAGDLAGWLAKANCQ